MDRMLEKKIEAEYRLRELLRSEGLPQPDEVEYGHMCVRFFYHESKTCVVVDLPTELVADERRDNDIRGDTDDPHNPRGRS
jgi:hypothetical protein